MSTAKITIQTTVFADLPKAWDYYTSPEHVTKWNFASEDWHCPSAQNDMRVGGKFVARMEAKDGSFGFDFEAVYQEIRDQAGFTYAMTDGRTVETNFEPVEGGTMITTTFDPEEQNSVEFQKQGWQAILDSYKRYTEAH